MQREYKEYIYSLCSVRDCKSNFTPTPLVPRQAFFTEQLGMPLTMEPNFEDYSCEMVFGRAPPPPAEDAAAAQPCLGSCPSARHSHDEGTGGGAPPCHKLPR